ncbi:hypothetical protein [Streptomyces sp. NPDC058252]|uniref:hypothetical protein n=1 Tax=Streptomyces sp. NPDC058252 TaxID=3346405 RepID=UPI0036E9A0D4
MENIRYTEVDGDYFVNVRDLAALYLATHDELVAQGKDSPYQGIAASLAIPFMELDGVQPGATLHIEPEGAALENG